MEAVMTKNTVAKKTKRRDLIEIGPELGSSALLLAAKGESLYTIPSTSGKTIAAFVRYPDSVETAIKCIVAGQPLTDKNSMIEFEVYEHEEVGITSPQIFKALEAMGKIDHETKNSHGEVTDVYIKWPVSESEEPVIFHMKNEKIWRAHAKHKRSARIKCGGRQISLEEIL